MLSKQSQTIQPLTPELSATKFVNYCGLLVRNNVSISFQRWKGDYSNNQYVVPQAQKNMLWESLKSKFNFTSEHEAKLKDWALSRMALLFQSYKKKLYAAYIKEGKVPDFNKFPKYRGHWKTFLSYKQSAEGMSLAEKNRHNASKKEYHHNLGPGGYKKAQEKWDQMEAEFERRHYA